MRVLVVGCGSIGKRHIRNLKTLNAGEIIACDASPERRCEVERDYGVRTYDSLEEALVVSPEVALICTPTTSHISLSVLAARSGCHLFIEKPLSHSLDQVDELIRTVDEKGLVTMVGCNWRFHFGIAGIKELLKINSIGRVIYARVQAGQYLPDWHPSEDYRQGYSANKSLGGGVILDGIQLIDYVRWFLGEVEQVSCFAGKLSSLEIDTEDTAEILLKFKSGAIAEVHLDYVQRPLSHSCRIVGEEGTILWDTREGRVVCQPTSGEGRLILVERADYDINQMYIAEIKHFLGCLQKRTKPMQDIRIGKKVLEIALAAKESVATGKTINLGGKYLTEAIKPS